MKLLFALCLMLATRVLAGDAVTGATVPPGSTSVSSHGIFQFVMPGDWKLRPSEKIDLGDRLICPASGSSLSGGLSYFAFEYRKTKTADLALKEFPDMIYDRDVLEMAGGRETSRTFGELNPGNADQIYYVIRIKQADGTPGSHSGIVLRTKARVYVLSTSGQHIPNVEMWREIAKSFKEL